MAEVVGPEAAGDARLFFRPGKAGFDGGNTPASVMYYRAVRSYMGRVFFVPCPELREKCLMNRYDPEGPALFLTRLP